MPQRTLHCCEFARYNGSTPLACQATCDADAACAAWTYHAAAAQPPLCTLRSDVSNSVQTIWTPPSIDLDSTSGVKRPSPLLGGREAELQLSANDTSLSIHVYVDQLMSEGFFQHGRVAMTRASDAPVSHQPPSGGGRERGQRQ